MKSIAVPSFYILLLDTSALSLLSALAVCTQIVYLTFCNIEQVGTTPKWRSDRQVSEACNERGQLMADIWIGYTTVLEAWRRDPDPALSESQPAR